MKADISTSGGNAQWKVDFTPSKKPWYIHCPECNNTYRWTIGSVLHIHEKSHEELIPQEEATAAHLSGSITLRKCIICQKRRYVQKMLEQK
jgi:hypothetical protein